MMLLAHVGTLGAELGQQFFDQLFRQTGGGKQGTLHGDLVDVSSLTLHLVIFDPKDYVKQQPGSVGIRK